VPENRRTGERILPLRVVVIPARSAKPREPIFILAGGPGQAATSLAAAFASASPEDHDMVFMDVRGTGTGHALDCAFGGSDEQPEKYLEPYLAPGSDFAACRDALQQRADLTQYTTPIAMRDVDELRQAMGYEKINLDAGSYGTRAALTYIRMFGDHVHAAVLNGMVPFENRAPLYHAAAAQRAFDMLVGECAAEARCRAAYPNLSQDLREVMERLRVEPARVNVPHPVTGAPLEVRLTASGFADALRVMLYSGDSGRTVPLLLQRAKAGDLVPFAVAAIRSSRGFKQGVRTGLLLSFTCTEDVARIRPDEIARETAGSFIGDQRVRSQVEACAVWPKGDLPKNYHAPIKSDVPVLIVSGNLDPVTPPMWGEIGLRSFPKGVHVVVPGGHTPFNSCVASLARQLYLSGTTAGLDTGCVSKITAPPFAMPASAAGTR
jgi:pimeloyl-ACP methyl ester carboxylesterase